MYLKWSFSWSYSLGLIAIKIWRYYRSYLGSVNSLTPGVHWKVIHTRRTTKGWERVRPPALFWKSKEVQCFWKKDPNCVHPWVESPIQNVVSRRKSSRNFSCGAFFLVYLKKSFSQRFNSIKPLHRKISSCAPAYLNLHLSATGLLKYVWPFSGHQALKGLNH